MMLKRFRYITWSWTAVLSGLLLLGVTGCNDDSWDDHYSYAAEKDQNLVKCLEQMQDYSLFVDAIKESGYDKILDNNNLYTVMAPTNVAMEKWMSDNPDGDLKKMVGNHLYENRYFMDGFQDSMRLEALNGKRINVYIDDNGAVKVNNNIIDIPVPQDGSNKEGKNGAIHKLDKVLDPVINIADAIKSLNSEEYSLFLREYARLDSIDSTRVDLSLGYDKMGNALIDTTLKKVYGIFNPNDEINWKTLFIPSDVAIEQQKEEMMDWAEEFGFPRVVTEDYYQRLFKAQIVHGLYRRDALSKEDTLHSVGKEEFLTTDVLSSAFLGSEVICSNGALNNTSQLFYEPIPADFVDSIMYEAEWGLGYDDHESTAVHTSFRGKKLVIKGGEDGSARFVFFDRTYPGDYLSFFLPMVFKGDYELCFAAKDQCKITQMQVGVNGEDVGDVVNLDTKQDGVWVEYKVGRIHQEFDGDMAVTFNIKKYTTYKNHFSIDYIKLKPVE